jgi:hypothetical protein
MQKKEAAHFATAAILMFTFFMTSQAHAAVQQQGIESLPLEGRYAVSAALGHDLPDYHVSIGGPMLALLATSSAPAKDLRFPVASYQGDELAKVREWEKIWVGEKVDSSNVDQVKEFLPESFYATMKDSGKWGESWFEIVPYKPALPSAGNAEMTKKYYGQSKLGPSGEILGYVSGVPFPVTKDATEMAHNFRTRSYGDSYSDHEHAWIVDGRLKYDMNSEIKNNVKFFSGRTDIAPVPEYPDNPNQIWRAFTMMELAPPEVRNMRILEIHYKDTLKAYDSWFWMPSIRRVRRRSTSERQDAQGGADYCAFDNTGWDGPIQINTYKYLGQKDLLMGRHTDDKKLVHMPGCCLFSGTQRERVKIHVIEATSKSPNFLYSKMVWYLDPENWQMLYSDRYDRAGKLWKWIDQLGFIAKGYNGADVPHFNATQTVDIQRIHGTLGSSGMQFGGELASDIFTLDYLQKHGY